MAASRCENIACVSLKRDSGAGESQIRGDVPAAGSGLRAALESGPVFEALVAGKGVRHVNRGMFIRHTQKRTTEGSPFLPTRPRRTTGKQGQAADPPST